MLIPDKLKLNKFIEVSIPRPSQIIGRLGLHDMKPDSFTGEETLPLQQSKLDVLASQNAEMWSAYQDYMKNHPDAD